MLLRNTQKLLPAAAGRKHCRVYSALAAQQKPASTVDVQPLFEPIKVGRFELAHRMVYPPLTRCRAPNTVPQPHMADYYAQRATKGGLIITEATIVGRDAQGYPNVPGIFTQQQVEAWKPVVKAVKDRGAVFFNQIWHCGRASHAAFQEPGVLPPSSSAVAISPASPVFTGTGMDVHPVPQPLDKAGIQAQVQAYANAARNAIAAGFDGVEIHGANGYLIDQFNKDSVNKRTDEYGGCIEKRCRFALEVVDAVVEAVGADRVGIRLSPFSTYLECSDSTPYATFMYLVEQLNKRKLAYLHMVEGRADEEPEVRALKPVTDTLAPFRKVWQGPFIAAGGYNRESGAQAVASGHADLIAYGRQWIANPDLPKRFQLNAPLNKYDRNTFYSPGMEGYLDYPFLNDQK